MASQDETPESDQYAVHLDEALETYTDTDDVFSPAALDGKGAAPVPQPVRDIKNSITRTDSAHSNLSEASEGTAASGDVSDLASPLMVAIEEFDSKVVEQLTKDGMDISDVGLHGMNAAHYLMQCYCKLHPADQVEIKQKLIDILAILVKNNLDLNAGERRKKQTPLHIAASNPGNGDVIKPLLASGSKINLPDGELKTALHHAVAIGDEDNVNALIEGGANPNLQDSMKQTVLHIAAKGRRNLPLVQFLLSCGAESNIQDIGAKTPLHIAAKAAKSDIVKELLNYGAHVNKVDAVGQTAMHLAAAHDITGKSLHELLSRPADVNVQDQVQGQTALHKAVGLQSMDNIKVLCKARADPNCQNILGETPLHNAFTVSEITVWQILMQLGGDINIRDNAGHSALFKALKANNGVALAVMRQYGVTD